MLRSGDILDNTYRIEREIGAGGTGVVYKAMHLRLNKYVVVKKIRDNIVRKINVRTEADILKSLHHEYLPQVYDFLQIGSDVFTIIDFIDGQSLDFYLRQRTQISEQQIITWARQLCETLKYLHGQTPKIIHSDIKPANIMITPRGDVCLIDFNISLEYSTDSVASGISPGYAPPEQYVHRDANGMAVMYSPENQAGSLSGNPLVSQPSINQTYRLQHAILDVRSDIYSLGATLYHLVTLAKPNIAIEPVIPLGQFNLPYSEALLQIIAKAMQFDPNKRYQSAEKMIFALNNIAKHDKRYRRLSVLQGISATISAVIIVGSVTLSYCGFLKQGKERIENYNDLIQQGKLCSVEMDFDQADLLFDQAQALIPTDSDAYYEKLSLLSQQEDYDKVLIYGIGMLKKEEVNTAFKLEPIQLANFHFIIGNAYFEKEEYPEAIEQYRLAVDENGSGNVEYYRDYAIAMARSGMVEQAQKVLEQATKQGLSDDSALLVKAELALAKNRYTQAAEIFNQVIDTTKDEMTRQRAYILCARCYRLDDKISEEVQLLEQARTALPAERLGTILRMLGDTYSSLAQHNLAESQGYNRKALDCYLLLNERGNASMNVKLNIAMIYQQLSEYQNAGDILISLLEDNSESYQVHMRLALLYSDEETKKPENERDYKRVEDEYKLAKKYYQQSAVNGESDEDMQILENLMQQIYDKNWL